MLEIRWIDCPEQGTGTRACSRCWRRRFQIISYTSSIFWKTADHDFICSFCLAGMLTTPWRISQLGTLPMLPTCRVQSFYERKICFRVPLGWEELIPFWFWNYGHKKCDQLFDNLLQSFWQISNKSLFLYSKLPSMYLVGPV